MTRLATQYGRYGYRRLTELLRREGWNVNHKRIERLWRQEGLKIPSKQPKRRRLWLNDGRSVRLLTLIDEYTRECLAIDVERGLNSESVRQRLSDLFVRRGVPKYIGSDNGPEFTAKAVRQWLERVGV